MVGNLFDGLNKEDSFFKSLDTPSPLGVPGGNTSGPQFDFGALTGTGSLGPVDGAPSFWDSMIGSKQTGPGWGKLGLGAIQGAGNLWLGAQNLKLGKENLSTSKKQFSDQFGLQKQLINQDIMDKATARFRANPALNPDPNVFFAENKV